MNLRTIYWAGESVRLIDQTLLPGEFREMDCRDVETLWEAIKSLRVRGAPAIGIAAALGVVLGTKDHVSGTTQGVMERLNEVCSYLSTSRPTAVNLFWALERMAAVAEDRRNLSPQAVWDALLAEAEEMIEEDNRVCRDMGRNGATLLSDGDVVLTHCNAGGLATAGFGTALGVIYAACEEGKRIKVYADETRPLLQGARLTAWELARNGVDVTVICDDMAASVMRSKGVAAVIVGADRIAANGDVANKIGTYGLAVLAKEHTIPFYVAAPLSTIDRSIPAGDRIPIEERDPEEVTRGFGVATVPDGVPVFNPAFDVTPAEYLTALVTERGIARFPYEDSIAGLLR